MWKNVEWSRLQPHNVPMVCAKSGVPTTTLIRQTLIQRRKVRLLFIPLPDSLQWIGNGSPWLWLFGHRARVSLPIAPDVRRRYNTVRAAVAVCVLLVVAGTFGPTGAPRLAAFDVGLVGLIVLKRVARRVWVSPRWLGVVRLRNPHSAFLAAVRGDASALALRYGQPGLVPAVPAVPVVPVVPVEAAPSAEPGPGWYPDPGGQHAARWWNGAAWTHQVRAESA
jgi:hypothetical protein